jgi:Transposase DDE domain
LQTKRQDMRFQWIFRFLSNKLVNCNEIMGKIIPKLIKQVEKNGKTVVLIIDQTKIQNGQQLLVISLRFGSRAIPLIWKVKITSGNIEYEEQKQLLEEITKYISNPVILLGDRFFGTADLIHYCRDKGWDYRLRLRNNINVFYKLNEYKLKDLQNIGLHFLKDVCLTNLHQQTNIGIIQEEGHEEPWIIAMNKTPSFYTTFDYGMRWAIEPMFSDFKSRGFGLTSTHLTYPDRVERLVLIMAIGMIWATLSGVWDANNNCMPYEKTNEKKLPAASFLTLSEV